MVPEQLAAGQVVGISFDVLINGNMKRINAVATAVYSICTGTEGFRIGFQFTDIDASSTTTLNELLMSC